jgi:hypothetical protein
LTVPLTSFFRGGGCITIIIILIVPTAFYRRLGRVCFPEFGLLLNAFGQLSIKNLDPSNGEGSAERGWTPPRGLEYFQFFIFFFGQHLVILALMEEICVGITPRVSSV